MAPTLAFLPGAALPIARPRARRATVIAVASPRPAEVAADLVTRDVGATPDVAFGALAPKVRGLVASLAVVLAGAAGAARAPQYPVAAKPAAAGVAAVITAVGVSTLRKGPGKAARKELAKAVMEVGAKPKILADAVAVIPAKFGISEEDFAPMKQTMYEYYLLGMLDSAEVAYHEISDLTRLKYALALKGPAIGDAHFEAARAFYRNNVVYLEAEDDDLERDAAQAKFDKLIFLSDRMYSDKDSEEAYLYECSRLRGFFRMKEDEYDARVARVALPFYTEVVSRACVDSSVTREDVLAAQATLGVRDMAAETIRNDAYANRVDSLVTQKGKLDSVDNESLSRLRALLTIPDDRASSTLRTLAEPVYRVEVGNALEAVTKGEESFASIYGRLALRRSELGLAGEAARSAMSKEVTERGVAIMRKASKYLRVQNINGCINAIKELLKYADGVVCLMEVANEGPNDDVATIKAYMQDVAAGLSRTEPRQMYRLFLSDVLKDRQITSAEENQLKRLRAVLGLGDLDALEAFKSAAGPVYKKAIADALAGSKFDDETKAGITKIKEDLALPLETCKSIDVDMYRSKLERLVSGNRILQENEAQDMFVLREFLGLTPEDAAPVHKTCMGPVYEQSVTEAMGPTGIMLDEYRNGLERLRDRLGLSKEDADAAFHRVVKQRMILYVNRAMSQLEKRQSFRGQNEQRDVGEDPNIKRAGAVLGIDAGGLPIELSNLVDFYVRNGLTVEEEVEVDGEKKTVTKYPVTLRGDIPEKVHNELYKQYVIQCFSAQTRSEKQRLFAALDQLGAILGMTDGEVSAIHSEIGTVIYKNYVAQTLLKGPIEDKDMEFLNNIQKMLSMKEETCTALLKDGKQNRVSVLLEQIFSQPKVLPETIKRMRETSAVLDVDIVKDLSISAEQRGRLFNVEIDAAIDSGALTADNQELVQEIQKGLQVEDNKAKEILLSCIQRRTLSHLVQASASLRQERTETAVAELRTMLRYGKLLPSKVIAPAVSLAEKQELFLLFQAYVITDGAVNEAAKEQINLLKTMFGFTDADLEAMV